MIIMIPEPERRKGVPMTSLGFMLSQITQMIDSYPYQPKSPEEAEAGFWFFERGKGWFLGDTSWISDRIIYDEDECGISVDGDTLGFQPSMAGSSPAFRSKKK